MDKPNQQPDENEKEQADPTANLRLRLEQKHAECAKQYDGAMDELRESHGEGESECARLQKLLDAMGPQVDAFVDQTTWTPAQDRLAQRYLATVKMLNDAQRGRRMAYGSTTRAGDQPLGVAIEDPGYTPLAERDDEA